MQSLESLRAQLKEDQTSCHTSPSVPSEQIQEVWSVLKNNKKTSTNIELFNNTLLCPHCGCENLHHVAVELYDRAEDAELGTHVKLQVRSDCYFTNRNDDIANNSMIGNPSARRGGVSVHMICEECEGMSEMTIAQHKGQTLVEMRSWE